MKKITLFSFLIIFSYAVSAQNKKAIASISKEICNCLDKYEKLDNVTELETAMENCVIKASLKNIEVIKKELDIDLTQGEEAGRQFGEVIAYELIKKCNSFIHYITLISEDLQYENDSVEYNEKEFYNPDLVPYEKYSTDSMVLNTKLCTSLKDKKLVYVNDNPDKYDYFIINKKKCIEYHDNEKYITHYDIHSKRDCSFSATFIESTNPDINNLLSKGDKVLFRIVGVYPPFAYLTLDFKGFSKTFKMSIQEK